MTGPDWAWLEDSPIDLLNVSISHLFGAMVNASNNASNNADANWSKERGLTVFLSCTVGGDVVRCGVIVCTQ